MEDDIKKQGFGWRFWVEKLVLPFALLIVGFSLARVWDWWHSGLKEFEYAVTTTPAMIPKPDLRGKDFKVTIDGSPVENISTVSVYLFNRTDSDFENVDFAVAFKGKDGKQPVLIHPRVSIAPDQYTTQALTSNAPDELRIGYEQKVMNRSDQQVFQGDYIFEGTTPPDAFLTVNMKGVTATRVSIAEPNEGKTTVGFWPTILLLSVGVSIGMHAMNYLDSIIRKRMEKKDKGEDEAATE